MKRLAWTQPCCDNCWQDHYPDHIPVRLIEVEPEFCVYCASPTTSGIYVRIDPVIAPHPTLTKGE
jgi:hypothetical protein